MRRVNFVFLWNLPRYMGGGLLFTFHIARLLAKRHVFGSEFQCIYWRLELPWCCWKWQDFIKGCFLIGFHPLQMACCSDSGIHVEFDFLPARKMKIDKSKFGFWVMHTLESLDFLQSIFVNPTTHTSPFQKPFPIFSDFFLSPSSRKISKTTAD